MRPGGGGGRGYADVTQQWRRAATPDSHPVKDLPVYTVKGVSYRVDGRRVVLDYTLHEKETAQLLERELGGALYMVPRINAPQGIPTPDYLFRGEGYDLKTISGSGRKIMYDRISKKRGQASNFIFDLSHSSLTDEDVQRQISYIYASKHTSFVKRIMVIRNGALCLVVEREKERS